MALPPLFGVTAPIPAYATETYALLAKMTTQPTAGRALIIDTCIRALQAADVWNKFDFFYVLGAADSQAARLNWVFPGRNTLTEVNSPAFVADQGYTGDGSTSYLDPGVAHNALVRHVQNSAHAGVWARSEVTSAKTMLGAANTKLLIQHSSNRLTRISATVSLSVVEAFSTGHVVGVRRDNANQYSYRNGGLEITAAAATQAPDATAVTVLKNATTFSNSQCFAAHIGTQLSAADVLAIYNALDAYRSSIGA